MKCYCRESIYAFIQDFIISHHFTSFCRSAIKSAFIILLGFVNCLCISKSDIIRHPRFSTVVNNLGNVPQVISMHNKIVEAAERENQSFLSALSESYSFWNLDESNSARVFSELQILTSDSLVRKSLAFKPYQILVGTQDSLGSMFFIMSNKSDSTFDLQYGKPSNADQTVWLDMLSMFNKNATISQENLAIVEESLEIDFQAPQARCKFIFDDKWLYSKSDSSWRSITFWPTFVEKVGSGCGEIGQIKK